MPTHTPRHADQPSEEQDGNEEGRGPKKHDSDAVLKDRATRPTVGESISIVVIGANGDDCNDPERRRDERHRNKRSAQALTKKFHDEFCFRKRPCDERGSRGHIPGFAVIVRCIRANWRT
jgi:hypothetical protein